MKFHVFLFCFIFLCDRLIAQSPDDPSGRVNAGLKTSVSTLRRSTILFHTPPGNSVYTGFSHFEVIDERVDTARIGIRARTGLFSQNRNRQLVFARPAAIEIAGYLNANFCRPGAPFTALVVLRTLWLEDANYTKEDLLQDPDKKSAKFQIRLKAEIYAGADNLYLPVLRYDSVAIKKSPDNGFPISSYPGLEEELSNLFNDLADSAALVAERKTGHGRKVSREQIREFNRSRFNIPMDSATVYTAGVYTSFEEFRNNAPSIHDFEIKTEGKVMLLYIKDATGNTYFSHDAWGYSDGKSLFIMKDGILWPAWKEGRAVYFYGLAYKIQTSGGGYYMQGAPGTPGYYVPSSTTTEKEVKCIYTVDMDTGELY